jgi:hypothetical protein
MSEKRIALIKEGVVFNIVVADSAPEMATLFDCLAIEVTDATGQAHVGHPFANGKFDAPPVLEDRTAPNWEGKIEQP